MAFSKFRSTLAVLRSHLGHLGGEYELGAMIGRSTSWVNKVSARRANLTWDVALRISMETGVCPVWLYDNDTGVPPVAVESGQPFDYEYFKRYRANLAATKPTMLDPLAQIGAKVLPEFVHRLARHFQIARSKSYGVEALCHHLEEFERDLRNLFPIDPQQNSPELDRAALDLCRLTARSWAPRRKGYQSESNFAVQSEGTSDTKA